MPVYEYRARDPKGTLIQGQMESLSKDDVKRDLGEKGLIPITVIESIGHSSLLFDFILRRNRVKAEDLAFFTRQFYTLVKAGMDMDSALSTLGRQTESKGLKKSLAAIRKAVAEGASLSKAMAEFPEVFDGLYIGMVAAGEEAGLLEEILKEVADILDAQQYTRAQIKAATFYPKLVLGLMTVLVGLMMRFVIPKFAAFYQSFNATLPLPTRILIAIVTFIEHNSALIVGVILVVVVGIRVIGRWKSVALWRDRLRLRLPIFGKLYGKIYHARFGRILAALYRSGISLPRSLDITSHVVGNSAFALEITKIKEDVDQGRTLAQAMEGKRYFSTLLVDSVAIGEKSGSLDHLLLSISEFYARESDITIKKLSTILEPLLLGFIFLGVGLLALAIYLPMFNMGSLFF